VLEPKHLPSLMLMKATNLQETNKPGHLRSQPASQVAATSNGQVAQQLTCELIPTALHGSADKALQALANTEPLGQVCEHNWE
jgi:uncharacterized protein (DUF697 family)